MAAETSLQVAERPSSLSRQTFEPATLSEAIEFSKMIADSDLVPKDFRGKPANILVALQTGKELGVAPMQALQGIAVINGRSVVWGDLLWAIVTSHPAFEDCQEEISDTQAKVILKRRGRSAVTVTFTQADAQKAGLWGKAGPWTQYPKRQLQWRARTFAARDLFPDALKGMTSAEEAMDYEGKTIDAVPAAAQPSGSSTPVQGQQASSETTIGKEKATEFYKTYRAFGHTSDESKAFLKEKFGIEHPKTSQDIPVSRWSEAEEWAKAKAPIRIKAEELFTTLGFTVPEIEKYLNEMKWDWAAVVKGLEAELARRDQEQQ